MLDVLWDDHDERVWDWRRLIESTKGLFADSPVTGPPTALHMVMSMYRTAGDPKLWYEKFLRDRRMEGRLMTRLGVADGAGDVDVAAEVVSAASLRPKMVDSAGVGGSGPPRTLTPTGPAGRLPWTDGLVMSSRCLDSRHALPCMTPRTFQ